MYLSTICYVLSDTPCNKTVDLSIITGNLKHRVTADLFTGGQRCLLPDSARDLIIEELLADRPVEIEVGIHRTEITSCEFWPCYNML